MLVRAYAAASASASLEPTQYEAGAPGANDVDVEITHCGICHSDLHLINNDWGITVYPIIPGHEAVGVVRSVGSGVKSIAVGDRVGIGWQADSCGTCEWCASEGENLCAQSQPTCVGRPGGFADGIRVNSRFVFPIPKKIDSADAGPLMCGGATVFTPLREQGVKKGSRVGIVGLGGLGHLAVQFAAAMGADVTVFSTHSGKKAEALRFGAKSFVDMSSEDELQGTQGSQDVILTTASADLPWAVLVNALRPRGSLVLLGVPPGNFSAPVFPLIAGSRKIVGSNTGSPAQIREMLDFAAKHGVRPQIEKLPMADVNHALARLTAGDVRYRVVLEA